MFRVWIEDKSRNGSTLNGERISRDQKIRLHDGYQKLLIFLITRTRDKISFAGSTRTYAITRTEKDVKHHHIKTETPLRSPLQNISNTPPTVFNTPLTSFDKKKHNKTNDNTSPIETLKVKEEPVNKDEISSTESSKFGRTLSNLQCKLDSTKSKTIQQSTTTEATAPQTDDLKPKKRTGAPLYCIHFRLKHLEEGDFILL